MIELKLQTPFIDENGVTHKTLEKHYAEDENGKKYYIIQKETGNKYDSAVDTAPCRYTYEATEEEIVSRETLEDTQESV